MIRGLAGGVLRVQMCRGDDGVSIIPIFCVLIFSCKLIEHQSDPKFRVPDHPKIDPCQQ